MSPKIRNLTLFERNLLEKRVKTVLKLGITVLALYIVLSQIEMSRLLEGLERSNPLYLFYALILFNLSKILSAIRLNVYFHHIGVKLSQLANLKLYYIGMFYNLSLPTGIGGDGYKIYLLKKRYGAKLSTLIRATLLDRLSGLVPLLFFAGVLFWRSEFYHRYIWLDWIAILGTITIIPLFYLINLYFFKEYIEVFVKTLILGGGVQILQLISAVFIVYAIGCSENLTLFLTLFLISSVVAVLPITIGGVGVRELTFLYGLTLVGVDATHGILFSMLFFSITAISSLIGLFCSTNPL